MLHDPLVLAFESGTIEPSTFRHREHLYVAWCYLRALPLEEALARYVRHLRCLTTALGAPGKFHATITWGYLILLDQAMQDVEVRDDLDALLARNPSLLEPPARALASHYAADELESVAARQRFVLPRRSGG